MKHLYSETFSYIRHNFRSFLKYSSIALLLILLLKLILGFFLFGLIFTLWPFSPFSILDITEGLVLINDAEPNLATKILSLPLLQMAFFIFTDLLAFAVLAMVMTRGFLVSHKPVIHQMPILKLIGFVAFIALLVSLSSIPFSIRPDDTSMGILWQWLLLTLTTNFLLLKIPMWSLGQEKLFSFQIIRTLKEKNYLALVRQLWLSNFVYHFVAVPVFLALIYPSGILLNLSLP